MLFYICFSIEHFIQACAKVIVIGLQRAQILGDVHETHVAELDEVLLESVHALRQLGHFFEILDLFFILFIKTLFQSVLILRIYWLLRLQNMNVVCWIRIWSDDSWQLLKVNVIWVWIMFFHWNRVNRIMARILLSKLFFKVYRLFVIVNLVLVSIDYINSVALISWLDINGFNHILKHKRNLNEFTLWFNYEFLIGNNNLTVIHRVHQHFWSINCCLAFWLFFCFISNFHHLFKNFFFIFLSWKTRLIILLVNNSSKWIQFQLWHIWAGNDEINYNLIAKF